MLWRYKPILLKFCLQQKNHLTLRHTAVKTLQMKKTLWMRKTLHMRKTPQMRMTLQSYSLFSKSLSLSVAFGVSPFSSSEAHSSCWAPTRFSFFSGFPITSLAFRLCLFVFHWDFSLVSVLMRVSGIISNWIYGMKEMNTNPESIATSGKTSQNWNWKSSVLCVNTNSPNR